MKNLFFFILANVILQCSAQGQTRLPYRDSRLPVVARVKDLLSRMTKEEKFWQLFMIPGQVDTSNETKFKNGIFGFQFSAVSEDNQASAQLLQYNTKESAVSLLKRLTRLRNTL